MERNLGEMPSTFRGDLSAYNLWIAYRTARDVPVHTSKQELSGDNAEDLILDLCRFASTRAIPINFDENLQRPANSKSNRFVVPTTLAKYVGKIIKYFREVDPDHPDWKDLPPNKQDAVPEWWSTLRPVFIKEVQTYQFLFQGDAVFGLEDIRPLYADLGLSDEGGKYPTRICDQKHVFVHLVKTATATNNNLQRAAIIHAIAEAIGRGGEAKFQTFRDWVFDYLWKVTNTPWKEKKTVKSRAMPRVADERWYADWYFIMGMYCMCEKGLYRTPQQKRAGLEQTVFPILHGMKDESATTYVTNTIRSALPESVRNSYSAKSLRQAGVGEASKHPNTNIFHLCHITGHATGNTSDDYRDSNDVGRAMPGVNALHGKKNLFTPVAVPKLSALGADKDSALELMKQVFQCNIESFDEGGDLYILKETFLASLLMHYEELERDCGVLNIVSSTLLRKADDAQITCADAPDLTCDRVLRRWSAAIKAEFKHETTINVLKMSDPPGQQNSAMLATLAESVNSLKMTVEKLDEKIDDLVQKNIDNEVTISLLKNQNRALRDEVTTLNRAAASRSQLLMTTPENNGNKRPRRMQDGIDDVDPFVIDETAASSPSPAPSPAAATTPAPVAPSTTNNTSTAAAAATSNNTSTAGAAATTTNIPNASARAPTAPPPFTTRNATLRFNHTANQVATGESKSMSGKEFGDALTAMASGRHNLLRGMFSKLRDAPIPSNEYGEKSHLRNCLELADFVAEFDDEVKEHIKTLRNAVETTSPVVIDDAAGSIVDACAAELDILVPPQGKCGTTISGMHRRIQKYKQEIKKKKKLSCKPGEVKLVRLEEEE